MVQFTPDLLWVLLVHHANTQMAYGKFEPQHFSTHTERETVNWVTYNAKS